MNLSSRAGKVYRNTDRICPILQGEIRMINKMMMMMIMMINGCGLYIGLPKSQKDSQWVGKVWIRFVTWDGI